MKSIFYKTLAIVAALVTVNSCNYLDIVPDDVATIDYAFRNRDEAEKYLFTCYTYRPKIGDLQNDPAMCGGDECWAYYYKDGSVLFPAINIAHANWDSNAPVLNYWDGGSGQPLSLWVGIRDCNIFLENIDKVLDVTPAEKSRWIAEVKFLKAYYHYYLLKCYGPVPIVDSNLPVGAAPDEVKVVREPVDKVVEYISSMMKEAAAGLPNASEVMIAREGGRIDRQGALAMRAELLLTAASPLFNGNADYRGHPVGALFNDVYDANKWKTAAEACKEAIDQCDAQHKELYKRIAPETLYEHDIFKLQTTYREAICDPWNEELLWGSTNTNWDFLGRASHPRLVRMDPRYYSWLTTLWAPTLKMAEAYYSSHGVPIEEDKEWDEKGWYGARYDIRAAASSGDEIYYVTATQRTVNLHFNREPRFYASIGFDRGEYFGSGKRIFNEGLYHCAFLSGEYSGFMAAAGYPITGYAAKKMNSFKAVQALTVVETVFYPFPIKRVADLYLMYAEALNEFSGPSEDVYKYVDLVRARVGLEGVRESWQKYAIDPSKPNDKAGLQDIIRRERTIELAFEGKRFWDLRRWKQINELNRQPQGWNIQGETQDDFYFVTNVARQPVTFTTKDYFFPIKESSIITNRNLVQNYGW